MLSSLKGAVKEEDEQARANREKAKLRGEAVPLYDNDPAMKEILPLFGEEIVVNKRMQQVGEAVITKRKVTETKRVSINVKGESVTAIHPDGNRELVQEKPFTATSA